MSPNVGGVNMSQETTDTTSTTVDSSGATTLARLLIHMKENNVSYLIGMLVAYQMGILDKFIVYGSGVCS